MPPRTLSFALVVAISFTTACAALRPATVPMATIERKGDGGEGKPILLVLLPGRADRAEKFFREGFDQIAKESGRRFDLISVEAHLGYYVKGQLELRLANDVLIPARERGYGDIWLVGASMGGFGALAAAQRYPGEIDGLILLAPYLGSERILESVESGKAIQAKTGSEDHRARDLWDWITRTPSAECPAVLLGVGEDDSFVVAARQLSRFLPKEDFQIAPGDHDWETWKRLFRWALAHPAGPGARCRVPARFDGD